jgi:hypothetical protein
LGLELAETLKVLNTITVGNSLIFLMVYNTVLTSYDLRVRAAENLTGFAESEFWQTRRFSLNQDFEKKFHDLPTTFEYQSFR